MYVNAGAWKLYSFSPVAVRTPTVQFTRLTLGSLYVGLNFFWRCEVQLRGRQLSGVSASVEWIGPNGAVITSDSRITVGDTLETSPGREYQKTLTFTPLSAGDSGSYSCSATVMPTISNSLVTSGMVIDSDSLSVASKTLLTLLHTQSLHNIYQYFVLLQIPLFQSTLNVPVSLLEFLIFLLTMASLSPAQLPLELTIWK